MAKKKLNQNKVNVRDKAEPKSKMYVGVKGEGDTVVYRDKKRGYIQHEKKQKEREEMTKPCIVINRHPHNMTLSYEGKAVLIAPRQRAKFANMDKLGGIPAGIVVLPIK